MEDVCPNNNSASLGAIEELPQDNMTDLYWQAAGNIALCQQQPTSTNTNTNASTSNYF